MQLPDERELKDYDRWKVGRPSHLPHGVTDTFENPLGEQLQGGNPRNWRLEGNILHCDTDFGPLAQRIPVDYICTGIDKKGLPILERVIL